MKYLSTQTKRRNLGNIFSGTTDSYDDTVEVSQNGSYQIRCKWLGVLPLKTIKVHTVESEGSAGSGSPVGIYMETKVFL